MTLALAALSIDELPDGVTAVAIPALSGAEGPEPMALGRFEIAGVPVPQRLDPEWCATQGFRAAPGQVLVQRDAAHAGAILLVVGLGEAHQVDRERWRRAAAAVVRAGGENGTGVFVVGPGEPSGAGVAFEPAVVGQAVAEGAALGAYRFEAFKTSDGRGTLERLLVAGSDVNELRRGVERGVTVSVAVAFARDLVNTPPSELTPSRFASSAAERLGGIRGTTVEVWDHEQIVRERLGGLLGVSRGSVEPPRLVRASYVPETPAGDRRVPHVALVGKGITFDSGGLSLKTPEGMTTMKTDMSGAAAVLGAISACAALDIHVAVTAFAPLTENMPGGRAIKPGDVLTARNGATIEVLNTDAEGRLVLADALSLATELEPDAIVDVATLTGAAVVALGTRVGALFGRNEALIDQARDAGTRAGEPLWPMPMPEDYRDHIDSDVADMKNIGKAGEAGAIAAALLLARFTDDLPWAHLDIAGPARSAESSGYLTKGGTGFGVRTLLCLLESFDASGLRREFESAPPTTSSTTAAAG